jgi:hypothetical protein
MRRLFGWLALALTVGGGFSADARVHAPYRGHRIVPATAAPLDNFATPFAAFSFRKLRAAYAGPAMRLRRISDSAEQDIGFAGGDYDTVAAQAFCAATTCKLVFWYDQSGTGVGTNKDLWSSTDANQHVLQFACLGDKPCFAAPSSNTGHGSQAFTPATGVMSASVVARRVSGTGTCGFFKQNGASNQLLSAGVANNWRLTGGGTGMNAAAADNVWHAGIAVLNGAGSLWRIDTVETTGAATGTVISGSMQANGSISAVCHQSEIVYWDNYVLTPAERAALTANQRSFWGF